MVFEIAEYAAACVCVYVRTTIKICKYMGRKESIFSPASKQESKKNKFEVLN
jgi:hypothetical protein